MKKFFDIKDNISEIGSFALPVFIEQAAIASMAILSTMLVSHINGAAVAGVNLVESLNYLIQQIFMSLEIGATVVVAQYCGRNDHKSASEACVQAMLTSVAIALMICAVMLAFPNQVLNLVFGNAEAVVYESGRIYFLCAVISFPFLSIYAIATASIRGSGNPRLSLVGVIVTNVSFVLLGLLFIRGFHLGVLGAGLGLIGSRVLGAVTGLILLKRGNSVLTIEQWIPKKIRWDIQKTILLLGIPSCIENIIFQAGRLTTQTFSVPFGTGAMTVNALSNSIAMFYNIPGNTAASISVPIVGKYLGMRNKENARQSSKLILALGVMVMGILSLLFLIFAEPVAGLFTADQNLIKQIAFLTRINVLISPVVWTFSFVTPAILRASGDVKYTTAVSILSMVLFRVTIGYLLAITLGFGVIGIWVGMFVDWTVRAVLFTIRYMKGKWAERVLIKEAEIKTDIAETEIG